MKEDAWIAFSLWMFIFGMMTGAVIIGLATKSNCDDWWRAELSRRGVAEYYLDGNNERQWHWREQQP